MTRATFVFFIVAIVQVAATRSIYVEGKVVADDGRSLPQPAAIERVCNGIVYREGHADSRADLQTEITA